MPYIKYRGAWQGSIREQVNYEDRSAPCYEGLARLMADARRFAEDKFNDAEERANAIRRYVDNHPYRGLEHIGGVGFVEDSAVRAIDEVIVAEEFQHLRDEIKKANEDYRIRKATELSKNNDPLRRANAEHEHLGWRTRVWVLSYTELEHHVPYMLSERSIAYIRVRSCRESGLTEQLVDIYHAAEGGIEQALFEGNDWAEVLVDLLALAGYGAAYIAKLVSTTVPYCRIGKKFELATFDAYIFNSPVPVHPNQFETAGFDPAGRLALRHLREGLSARLPTVAFAAHWNALERQAEEEARLNNRRRVVKCKACGVERTAGWDLKRGFEAMYTDAGLDPSMFDEHRKKRGMIQHGGKLQRTVYLDEIIRDLPQIQAAAMAAVAKRVGIAPGTITYLSTSWPVSVFSCCVEEEGRANIQFKQMSVPVTAGMLPQRKCGEAERTIRAGMLGPLKIDPLALPPVQY